MTDKHPTYILSVRSIGVAFLCILLAGALGGGIAAWVVVRRIGVEDIGQRVIQRVEQPARDPSLHFARVVETVRPTVLGLLSGTGEFLGSAVVLTGDGLALSLLPSDRTIPRQAIRADGSLVPVAFVREYEELGLILFRVPGSYSAPQFMPAGDIRPGIQGIAVGLRSDADDVRTSLVSLESVFLPSADRTRQRAGLGPLAVVTPPLESPFFGAPVWNGESQLMGVLLRDDEGSAIVMSGDLDTILQDTLRHPSGEEVRVLGGLRGSWISRRDAREQSLPGETAFVVETPPSALPAAADGLKRGDVVTSVGEEQLTQRTSLWSIFLAAVRDKQTLPLGVLRDGVQTSVTLSPAMGPDASPSPASNAERSSAGGPRPSS